MDTLTDDRAQDATMRERQEGVVEIPGMGLVRLRTRNKGFWPSVVAAGGAVGAAADAKLRPAPVQGPQAAEETEALAQ